MRINLKNFGLLEALVTLSVIYVIGMLIWTASTRPAVEAKANLVKENHQKVVDFINYISPNINKVIQDMNWDINNQLVKISNMWAIINIGGASNARHHHGNSAMSAAYYVRAPKNCGDIVFYDPRPAPVFSHPRANGPNTFNAMVNSISPIEGGLVLFPSYLDHSVNPK